MIVRQAVAYWQALKDSPLGITATQRMVLMGTTDFEPEGRKLFPSTVQNIACFAVTCVLEGQRHHVDVFPCGKESYIGSDGRLHTEVCPSVLKHRKDAPATVPIPTPSEAALLHYDPFADVPREVSDPRVPQPGSYDEYGVPEVIAELLDRTIRERDTLEERFRPVSDLIIMLSSAKWWRAKP